MDVGAYETAVLNLAVQVLNLVRASFVRACPSARARADRHSDIYLDTSTGTRLW